MKKLILIASTLLTLSTAVQARYFNMAVQCYADQAIAECVAYNDSNQVLFCRGRIYGQTSYGFRANGNQRGTVYPGQRFYMKMYANNPYQDPLVDAWGNVECRTQY